MVRVPYTKGWRAYAPAGAAVRGIDLFAGCGGLTLGAHSAGVTPIMAVEMDPAAAASYSANHDCPVVIGDVAAVNEVPEADVVIGGPPCQGFSTLGAQRADDPRNGLAAHMPRIALLAGARAVVAENVPGGAGAILDHFVEGLPGWTFAQWELDASHYGAPTVRRRVFTIAVAPGVERPFMPRIAIAPLETVRDAIGDLPEPTGTRLAGLGPHRSRDLHVSRPVSALSLARYRSIPPGGDRRDIPSSLLPPCWQGVDGRRDAMGRLHWGRPAVTIRTDFTKPEKGRYLHPEQHRSITLHEGARLQGFPDDYLFFGTKLSISRQIGNAVPPPLAAAVLAEVVKVLKSS